MSQFAQIFGSTPDITSRANGRVNLIGEHTDYNGGYVLPTSIPQSTRVELKRRTDNRVRLASENVPGTIEEYTLGEEKTNKSWTDYIQGVTWVLRRELGAGKFQGFDALIASEVPMGSGLSSSAALEVSVLKAIRDAFKLDGLDDVRIARLGQMVENDFVGARVGIMDQMAAALATDGIALFLDTRSMETERVPIPRDKMEIVVINSGVTHSNAHGGYNQRRSECEKACELLGVSELRDLGMGDLARLEKLPMPMSRRARHVITENDRVLQAVKCLREKDVVRLGELFKLSHLSMRDDYEVSVPEIDKLVEIASAEPDVYGARLTGGGFGGSIVIAAKPGTGKALSARVAEKYQRETGRQPTVLIPA